MDTKEKILQVSLELFAQKGYSAVSIRDICKLVGIKESTIYYHFQNKQAIFDTLTEQFSAVVGSLTAPLSEMQKSPIRKIDEAVYQKINHIHTERFLMDDFCNAFIRAMYIEQFGNEAVRALFVQWMFDAPLSLQEQIFAQLIKAGALPPTDARYLAVQYYAPIWFYFQRYLLIGKLTEEKKAQFRQTMQQHFTAFMQSPQATDSAPCELHEQQTTDNSTKGR